MKRAILLFLIVVSFSSLNLKAQDSGNGGSSSGLYLGAKASYGIVNFESILEDEDNFAEKTWGNTSFGIIAGYKLNGLISFQLEGNYASYGARNIIPTYIYSSGSPLLADYGDNSTVDRVDMKLNNIDIPLTIKLTLGEGNLIPYVYGGVNFGINANATTTIVRQVTLGDATSYRNVTDDVTDRVISNEIAPVAGGGVMMNISKLVVFGDLRYKQGFKNLSNVDNNFGFRSSALWISAGICIYL